jgi:hypothetical protein
MNDVYINSHIQGLWDTILGQMDRLCLELSNFITLEMTFK